MKNSNKKRVLCLLVLASSLLFSATVFGATHSSGPKWVRSTEIAQLYYKGEAYSVVGRGVAHLSYYRAGAHLGSITAVVHTWSGNREDYKTMTVRDSLNPWAPKTEYRYHF